MRGMVVGEGGRSSGVLLNIRRCVCFFQQILKSNIGTCKLVKEIDISGSHIRTCVHFFHQTLKSNTGTCKLVKETTIAGILFEQVKKRSIHPPDSMP